MPVPRWIRCWRVQFVFSSAGRSKNAAIQTTICSLSAPCAKADLLIAGDKDLLVLGSYKGTRILTPAEYVVGAG